MYLIRLLIVGDTGVGKTSLLVRFHENKFIVNQKTTIGRYAYLERVTSFVAIIFFRCGL